jgi:hypothetical protein
MSSTPQLNLKTYNLKAKPHSLEPITQNPEPHTLNLEFITYIQKPES